MQEPVPESAVHLLVDLALLHTLLPGLERIVVPPAQLQHHIQQSLDSAVYSQHEAVLASPDLRYLYSGHWEVAQRLTSGSAEDICVGLVSDEQLQSALVSEELFTASECAAAIALKLPWSAPVQTVSFESIVLAATRGRFGNASVFDQDMQRPIVRALVNAGLAYAKYTLRIRFKEDRMLSAFTQTELRASITNQFTQLLVALVQDARLTRAQAQAVARELWTRIWAAFDEMKRPHYHYHAVRQLLAAAGNNAAVTAFARDVVHYEDYFEHKEWFSTNRDVRMPAANSQRYATFVQKMQEIGNLESLKDALQALPQRIRLRAAAQWPVVLLAIHCFVAITFSETRYPSQGLMIMKICGPWIVRAFFEFGKAFYQ